MDTALSMASSTSMSSAQEQLLASLLPKIITTGKSRKYRDAFNRRIKHHNYGRTNQFEVTDKLDGLEEKFQILNRDDLSDALRTRRVEIRAHNNERRCLPDVMDLLVRLSMDPANIQRSDRLISKKEEAAKLPPLRWVDIEENDPIDHNDAIWHQQEHSDLSSDEDPFVISSTATSPQSVKRQEEDVSDRPSDYADKVFHDCSSQGLTDLSTNDSFGEQLPDGSVILTELQVTRECLFMLQGLPTRLYSDGSTTYDANTRYHIDNVSQEVFGEVLRSFARIGKRVEFVRGWVTETRATQYTKALQNSVASLLSDFDAGLSEIQARLWRRRAHVGILPALEAATRYFEALQVVSTYLQTCEATKVDSIGELEVLFDLICAEQTVARSNNSLLLFRLFVLAFQVYLKPVMHWIVHGELHEDMERFFVTSTGQPKILANVWESWFMLDESHRGRRCPRFLSAFAPTIFAMGKTVLFMRRIDGTPSDELLQPQSLLQADAFTQTLDSDYLNFAETFAEAVWSIIKPTFSEMSARLYQELDQQCGLWAVLDAFDCIYFGKCGPTTDIIETTLFRRLDKCSTSWSDRFLLLDLLEDAFTTDAGLDTDHLVVHSSHTSSRSLESRRRSVKILGDLSVDYKLPWQIANILRPASLASCRRIALILMQTRRSRDSLERRAYVHVMNGRLGSDPMDQNTLRALYHKLLLFTNTLYSHLTALVIETSTSKMKARLRQASTVDEVITVHSEYVTNLEKACFTSKKLTPIRDTFIAILDLSVRFSDIVSTPPGRRMSDDDVQSFRSAASRRQKRRQGEDSDEEDEISSGDEGHSTFVVLDELTSTEEFKRISKEFDRHLTFFVAGLKSLSRVDGEESWDILAGRLDWKGDSRLK